MKKIKTTTKILSVTALSLLCAGFGVYCFSNQGAEPPPTEVQVQQIPAEVVPVEELFPYKIEPKTTLSSALRQLNVSSQVIHDLVEAAKPETDLGRLNAGTRFQLYYENGPDTDLIGVKFRFSAIELLELRKINDVWKAEKITENVETRVMSFSGLVSNTLWASAQLAQMDPNLISDLAEIFAWQVDFAREVRVNDRWRLTVEQKFVKGHPVGWGSILAAEYENAGELYKAVLFRMNGEDMGYFAPDGSSLRRMFLKSPIRYGRISSRFQTRRFHPVLKVNRPHHGVDYAAPIGTPIRAVGSGVVTFAGWSGGGGNVIKLRHNSTYETAYKHLSRLGPGVRRGTRVQQGQTIGYVGTTGLSTGPHLHFEFYVNGRYVDPLGQKFPSADPVPSQFLTQFQSEATSLLHTLPDWGAVSASLESQNDQE